MVVFGMPDGLTEDAGSERGQAHPRGHGRDLGQRHRIQNVVDTDEDTERLASDDLSSDGGPQGAKPRQSPPIACGAVPPALRGTSATNIRPWASLTLKTVNARQWVDAQKVRQGYPRNGGLPPELWRYLLTPLFRSKPQRFTWPYVDVDAASATAAWGAFRLFWYELASEEEPQTFIYAINRLVTSCPSGRQDVFVPSG
ncbi:hypothetical protein ACFWFS_25835 [Streptomyces albidoflavus]